MQTQLTDFDNDEPETTTHTYSPNNEYVDQKFIETGRYDY